MRRDGSAAVASFPSLFWVVFRSSDGLSSSGFLNIFLGMCTLKVCSFLFCYMLIALVRACAVAPPMSSPILLLRCSAPQTGAVHGSPRSPRNPSWCRGQERRVPAGSKGRSWTDGWHRGPINVQERCTTAWFLGTLVNQRLRCLDSKDADVLFNTHHKTRKGTTHRNITRVVIFF